MVNGYTEIDKEGKLYRSHPMFPKERTKEKWVIVLAAEYPHAEQDQLIDSNLDAKISTRIILHYDNNTWMVPLATLVEPCFLVYKKDYNNTTNDNMHIHDRTAYIVEPMTKWGDSFLPINEV